MKSPAYAKGVAENESTDDLLEKFGARKVVVICPTRNRPERCKEMIESFLATRRGNTSLVCYVSEDDPQLSAYKAMAFGERVSFEFGPRKTIVEVFNTAPSRDADYFCDINDDHIYRTAGWDLKLIASLESIGGHGMAYGYTDNLPTACMVTANCIRSLGWFFPPGFRHQYVDNAIFDLYHKAEMIVHDPQVMVEHCHPMLGRAPMDSTYSHLKDSAQPDKLEYERWTREDFANDLARLKTAKLKTI
jgi:hypothetical protein